MATRTRSRRPGKFPRGTSSTAGGPVVNNAMASEIIANALLSRASFMRKMMDPRRDIPSECGYPEPGTMDAQMFREMYETEAVAARVVEVLPKESWQIQPQVYEDEDSDTPTAFEEAWDTLGKNLRGTSFYQDEEGSPIWEVLRRADELSGIGHFGIILLGIDDGKELNEPAVGLDPRTGEMKEKLYKTESREGTEPKKVVVNRNESFRKLLYLRIFDEPLVQVTKLETDKTSRRFGQPVMYRVSFANPTSSQWGEGYNVESRDVHWTRVIHIADNLGSSEIFGTPRMQQVYRNLYNLMKLYGGSAEMYWRGAFPGLSIESHPNLNPEDIDSAVDTERTDGAQQQLGNIREEAYDYQQGLDRVLVLLGMSAKSLAPQVVDPTPQISTQIEAICIKLGCPVRVFKGSERGELASSQDDSDWNERITDRQTIYITPRIIVPFVDRLICIGVLPVPKGFSVYWPPKQSLSELEKADVALKRTDAMAKAVGGGVVPAMMAEMDFHTRILGFTEEEAEAIINNAAKAQEEAVEKNLEMAEEGLNPDGTPKPEPEDRVLKPGDNLVDKEGKVKAKIPAPPGKKAPPVLANVDSLYSPLDPAEGDDLTYNYDPTQPRDKEGKWAGATHGVALPKSPGKLSIMHAGTALAEMGFRLGMGSYDLKAKEATYTITDAKGTVKSLTGSALKEMVYAAARKVAS